MTTADTTVSLIATTYNWKAALARALASVAAQRRLPDEVIVADDGSRPDTRAMLESIAPTFPIPLRHVWQEDTGFRAARARNRGIAAARGDYLVLIDGDMVLHPQFIADHLAHAQPGCWLQGGRLQASAALTARLLEGAPVHFHPWIDADFHAQHGFDRQHALRVPWLARRKARASHGGVTVMSCNMSAWRADLLRVNGFDERMQGYGSEDLELDVRFANAGVARHRLAYAALALHLAHASRKPVDPEDMSLPNNRILAQTRREKTTRCESAIDRHLEEFRAQPAPDLRKGVSHPAAR